MVENVVIAGAGHAAGQLVSSLKQQKYAGKIVLVGDERYLPYQRPPLSKKFLAGEMPAERLYVKPATFYDDPQIDVRLQSEVTAIDRDQGRIVVNDTDAIAYSHLVLALGSRVRRLRMQGADLPGVHYLRTIDDVGGIREAQSQSERAVIVGAGYIGLEVAAILRQQGLEVTVIEMADRVMSRVVSPEVSDFYQLEHANHGVAVRLNTGISAFVGEQRVSAVASDDGQTIPADFVVVGVGIDPNTELAAAAGLAVDNGIVVDEKCRSNDPRIYAVGDCTLHPSTVYGRKLRLESVQNALEQAKTAALNICGQDATYSAVPWFWSDQFDLKLQIAGLSEGFEDVVIRGNPAKRSFACLYLKEGRLIATDAINSPRDFIQSKALIANGGVLDRERLADPTVQLKDL